MFNLRPSQQSRAPQAFVNNAVVAHSRHAAHEDMYPCVECAEHFSNAVDRATHLRTAHSYAEGFLCNECVSSCSDPAHHNKHMDDHSRNRIDIATYCEVSWCQFQSCSTEVVDRHQREDHNPDDSLRAHCSECAYTNDSIVGMSVHRLYVHTEEGRSLVEAARRAREVEMLADQEAAAAAAKEASDTSSEETVEGSQSDILAGTISQLAPVPQPAPVPRLTAVQQQQADENAAASNAFLAEQNRQFNEMSAEDREQIFCNHRERKRQRLAAKKAGIL